MQINLFKRVKRDILERMDIILNSMANRFIENPSISKKYPNFLNEIDTIGLACKEQVVESLLELYKFQHLIQIIRWQGESHE